MKLITKFALVSVLALSAVPAFAASALEGADQEARLLVERNTYLFSQDGREIARTGKPQKANAAFRAFAHEPAPVISNNNNISNY